MPTLSEELVAICRKLQELAADAHYLGRPEESCALRELWSEALKTRDWLAKQEDDERSLAEDEAREAA